MAIRNIVQEPNEILRKQSKKVLQVTDHIREILDDMKETMQAAEGVGLAAPQIGILRQIIVIDTQTDGIMEIINPEIISTEGTQSGEEGCLSVAGRVGIVTRPMKVCFKALDRNGEMKTYNVEGLMARAIMHETAHLRGELFIDIMDREIFDDELEEIDEETDE